jgi:integrase
MKVKLTAAMVRMLSQETPPVREIVYFDVRLPRFALRVRPPSKPGRPWPSHWLVYYSIGHRDQKIALGSPATMDLDVAMKKGRELLMIVDNGGDPAADRAEGRELWSVKDAVEHYLASNAFMQKTEKVRLGIEASLRLHVVHRLASVPLGSIDAPRVHRLVESIEQDTRTNRRSRRLGGPGAAKKTIRILSSMLTWCVSRGQLQRNPVKGEIRLTGDGERETVITSAEDYARLFGAMDALVTEGALRPMARAFITAAALTGMRRGELQALRWRNVDLTARRLTIVSSKGSKLARNGPKTETVSLPAYAAAAMAAVRPDDAGDDELVFIPRRGERLAINRDWIAVRDRAGLPADLTLHGLRHSTGTVAVIAGLSAPEVQKLLRHRNIATTSKYIHLADTARLQDRAMTGVTPPLPAASTTG